MMKAIKALNEDVRLFCKMMNGCYFLFINYAEPCKLHGTTHTTSAIFHLRNSSFTSKSSKRRLRKLFPINASFGGNEYTRDFILLVPAICTIPFESECVCRHV